MNWKMRLLFVVLVLVLVGLQYRLWIGEGSLAEVNALKHQLTEQKQKLSDLTERNAALRAEVDDLKQGLEAVEARARSELGMIREGETYFQLVEPEASDD